MALPDSVAIAGTSLAGFRCAQALRRGGFTGPITMINGETHRPYDRPPLSKQVLRNEWDVDRIALADPAAIEELGLGWLDATRATGLDPSVGRIHTTAGEVDAEAIVVATGASPRRLPGTDDLVGVHVLRTLDDAIGLREALSDAPLDVVVVGAGFIGAEVAASARSLGHRVTIVEADLVPMRRGLGAEMGARCGELHRENGVRLLLDTTVSAVLSADQVVTGVRLPDDSELAADVLVVGIGVVPNTDWLATSGLVIDDGVVCDEFCAAAPNVWAVGDIARWPNPRFDQMMRVEHWDNAIDQAGFVAKRILGEGDEPYAPIPWFWSDQYEAKLQLAGRPGSEDTTYVVTGAIDSDRFAVVYGNGDTFTGVFGMNRPRQVMQYRRLLAEGASLADALSFAADEASS
ncbi:MAG: NAD(P)/FAD-dependent oxidoreductase [Acidimicrobiales bacterium]